MILPFFFVSLRFITCTCCFTFVPFEVCFIFMCLLFDMLEPSFLVSIGFQLSQDPCLNSCQGLAGLTCYSLTMSLTVSESFEVFVSAAFSMSLFFKPHLLHLSAFNSPIHRAYFPFLPFLLTLQKAQI